MNRPTTLDNRFDKVRKRIGVGNALILILSISFVMLFPADAWSHVKWFYPYDLSKPPRSIGAVLTPTFVSLYLLSMIGIYTFFWVDRYLYRKRFLADRLAIISLKPGQSFWILRVSVAIFFASLFLLGLDGAGFVLTPELRTEISIVPWIQLGIAGFALYRPTTPLVGVGIFILYGIAIAQYGFFHKLDYLIFLGVGVYFLLSGLKDRNWLTVRYVVLFASTGLTLLWASIEKWGYPDWTYPLMQKDPSLLMGMSPQFFIVFAGFVEFNITFILLSSASIFSRIVALGLQSVFILAIYKFGLVDAIGHLLIIAILLILVVRGPTPARTLLVLSDRSLWTEAYFMTGLYVLAFNVMFIAYYGLYFLSR